MHELNEGFRWLSCLGARSAVKHSRLKPDNCQKIIKTSISFSQCSIAIKSQRPSSYYEAQLKVAMAKQAKLTQGNYVKHPLPGSVPKVPKARIAYLKRAMQYCALYAFLFIMQAANFKSYSSLFPILYTLLAWVKACQYGQLTARTGLMETSVPTVCDTVNACHLKALMLCDAMKSDEHRLRWQYRKCCFLLQRLSNMSERYFLSDGVFRMCLELLALCQKSERRFKEECEAFAWACRLHGAAVLSFCQLRLRAEALVGTSMQHSSHTLPCYPCIRDLLSKLFQEVSHKLSVLCCKEELTFLPKHDIDMVLERRLDKQAWSSDQVSCWR